jgi:hypothetical protein
MTLEESIAAALPDQRIGKLRAKRRMLKLNMG